MNKIIPFILPLIYCFWGCGSQKVVATKYYVIEIPMDSVLERFKDIPPATEKYCEISQVDVNPAYSSLQIANRNNSRVITYYSHHHWAIRPTTSFTRLTLDYLKHAPIFRNVSDRFWRIQPDYLLETTVYHLEVIQDDRSFSAHLNLEFRLKETITDKDIVKHRADRYMELENSDLNLFATAVGEIFYQELVYLSDKIMSEIGVSP
jgi:ABC-type uncharacterized transport system auxiliary subunit